MQTRTELPTMSRTYAGFWTYAGFYVRGRHYKYNDIFRKLRACRPRLLLRCPQAMGRSMGP